MGIHFASSESFLLRKSTIQACWRAVPQHRLPWLGDCRKEESPVEAARRGCAHGMQRRPCRGKNIKAPPMAARFARPTREDAPRKYRYMME